MNRTRRASLFLGCALAALAAPSAAWGQAFPANPATVGGSVTYDRSVPGVDTVTVNSPSAVIDWTFISPIGNPIVFLPAGNTAIFQNSVNNPNFAVLNRIVPAGAPILMDGHVISQLQTLGGGTVPGGTVVFSSPTGLVIGPKAVFDVGNLMLTTLNPTFDASGTFIFGGTILLNQGNFPPAALITQPGSQINAPAEGSWVALVAPQVTHGGAIRVNGSAALVGAEAVAITINAGLFDIEIETGSSQANPIVHTGTTGGPASAAAGDNHVIYMVATPQAAPITMLLSGSVGFDPAVSAAVENGAIILSAGHDVLGTEINPFPVLLADASARITSGTFSSDVTGRARTDFLAGGSGAGTLTFQQDASLSGYARAHLVADAGYVATVGGNLILSAANTEPVDLIAGGGPDVTGGEALIRATGFGQIAIAGNATVDASAQGGVTAGGLSGRGTGGSAIVVANQGNIDVTGNLVLASVGTGAQDDFGAPRPVGGPGNGGTAGATALNAGDLHVGGNVQVDARGIGSSGTGEMPGNGGDGTGGNGRVEALGEGSVRIDGGATVNASATGGDVLTGAGNTGGAGQGGNAQILAVGGTVDIAGPALVASNGSGGSAAAGGNGGGGLAAVDAAVGRVALASTLQAQASGAGGAANVGPGGRGGDGAGGQVRVVAHSNQLEGAVTATATNLVADGIGGTGAPGGGGLPGGRGGDGAGGIIGAAAEAGNGRLQLAALTAQSRGIGGNGGDGLGLEGGRGGNGTGGIIGAGTVVGPPIGIVTGRADFASVAFTAPGLGGNGGAGAPAGAAGGGSGGSAALGSAGAPVTVAGTAALAADGTGGISGAGQRAPAAGGDVTVIAAPLPNGPAGSLVVGALNATSIATGDASNLNLLGRWRLIADGSPIRIGTATLTATATGAPTVPTASEIQLLSGTVTVLNTGLFSSDGQIRLVADGTGQLIGGDLTLNGRNAVILTHAARPPALQTIDATRFTAITTGNYDAAAGTSVFARTGVDIQAGGNAVLGPTNGTTALTVTAGGIARFLAPATAQSVTVTSADIDVTPAGSLGDAGTNLVALQVQPNANATTLGAGAQGPGYTLTQGEAGRLQANIVRVAALTSPAAGTSPSARILVHDLTLSAAAARAFEILTPGVVRVDGALLLGNAGAANRIGINAGTRLEVATPGGGVRVRSAAGAPAGTLTVAAGDIWVGDPALLAQLAANPNFPGRDDALLDNPGADQQRGAIEADGVTLAPRTTLYVQNSGTPAAFAGITVGPGGLTLDPSGGAPASVYAFGNRLNPDGSFTNNIPFFFQVDYSFGNSAGYTDQSEFNHCLINTPKCGAPFGGIRGTTPDFFFGYFPIPPQEPPGEPLEESGIGARPLIEEPVTSGSDSTFWADPGDEDDEDDDEGGEE
ncbi:MAG: hypothetical protein QOI38_2888 [Sphingomonadales bacterium]|nr:hypothetical protein [Sphingomonadales bacterium]